MKAKAEVRFVGRVQGVYFRDFTRRYAESLGVKGCVMNMPDGSVKAIFEGERELVEELIRKLRTEHPAARVDDVEIDWSESLDGFVDFRIRYR